MGVQVQDIGAGGLGDHINHIFEPFYGIPRIEKGTGLGLFIAKTLVQAHSGSVPLIIRIKVSQVYGSGFPLFFPVKY
jgi:signal transduction histidine kinase